MGLRCVLWLLACAWGVAAMAGSRSVQWSSYAIHRVTKVAPRDAIAGVVATPVA